MAENVAFCLTKWENSQMFVFSCVLLDLAWMARVSPVGKRLCSQPGSLEMNIPVNKLRAQGPA